MSNKKNSSPRKLFLALWTFLLVFCRFLPAARIPCVWTGVERIVAIGDLHGDYDNFVLILKNPKVGLVDDNLRWTGGKTHFVQTGDILDRGDRAKEILDLLMRLEVEAEAAGGKVHVLLGNHEELTITGLSLSYPGRVSPRQFVSFLSDGFRQSRERQYFSQLPAEDLARVQAQGGDLGKNPDLIDYWDGILKKIRLRDDPEASLAYIKNFNLKYGKWLLQKNSVIRINDIIFAHGGVNLQFSKRKMEDINDLIRKELEAFALHPTDTQLDDDPIEPKMVYNPLSPLWYREDDVTSQSEIDEILANLGAGRMVVGHNFAGVEAGNPVIRQEDGVARLGQKVWMIDTGIGYADVGGTLYALIITDGKFDSFSGRAEAAGQGPVAGQTSEGPQTADEIEKFLSQSTPQVAVRGESGRTDPWRVKLESGGVALWAQFKYINRPRPEPMPDSFKYELAAYELNKYLGLSFVPPAVERTINDTQGSLQAFVDGVIRESDIGKENFRPSDPGAFDRAMADLRLFENLVYDSCDNGRDTLIHKDTGKIYRVDFSEAFAPENGLIQGCEILRCSRGLCQKLREWDQEKIKILFTPYLNEGEILALHARRGLILQMIDKQIEERGEGEVLF